MSLWVDARGQIVASADWVRGRPDLVRIAAPPPPGNLAAYYVAGGEVLPKTGLGLATSRATIAVGATCTVTTAAQEDLVFWVTDGHGGNVNQSVTPQNGTATVTFGANLAGQYRIRAIGDTSISDTITITVT